MNEERKQQYFAELAPRYSEVTGNTTEAFFDKFLNQGQHNITAQSVVHDNASGPGTATQVLLRHFSNVETAPTVFATDYARGMIDALENIKATNIAQKQAWSKVSSAVMDSADLSAFEDEYFTHSINNFSLFTITRAVKSLQETYRTLKPDGVAAVLLWKRFAIEKMLASAQDMVKGEGYAAKHAVPVNGPQYFKEGVVEGQMEEAGFEKAKMKTFVIGHVLTPNMVAERKGLYDFMTSTSVAAGSVKGWSEEEAKRWPQAVESAMKQEDETFGGLNFESWVTVAQK